MTRPGNVSRIIRAIGVAALAAAVLPGGIAISSYSGPQPTTRVLHPRWAEGKTDLEKQCAPFAFCDVQASAEPTAASVRTSAEMRSPENGLVPNVTSSSLVADEGLRFTDNFREGSKNYVIYRITLAVTRAETEVQPPLLFGPSEEADLFANVTLRSCGCRFGSQQFVDQSGTYEIEVFVPYSFSGPVDVSVSIEEQGSMSQLSVGSLAADSTAVVRRVERIWA